MLCYSIFTDNRFRSKGRYYTFKNKYINAGTYLRDLDKDPRIRHDMNNLNLWNIKTHDNNTQVGDSSKVRYFNGWPMLQIILKIWE